MVILNSKTNHKLFGWVANGDADRPLSIGALLECQAIIPHYQRVNEIEEGCSHRFDSCPSHNE
jgi:hypothetical protein